MGIINRDAEDIPHVEDVVKNMDTTNNVAEDIQRGRYGQKDPDHMEEDCSNET